MNIRPITADEETLWNELMESRHPLGNPKFAGHQIKYILKKKESL